MAKKVKPAILPLYLDSLTYIFINICNTNYSLRSILM